MDGARLLLSTIFRCCQRETTAWPSRGTSISGFFALRFSSFPFLYLRSRWEKEVIYPARISLRDFHRCSCWIMEEEYFQKYEDSAKRRGRLEEGPPPGCCLCILVFARGNIVSGCLLPKPTSFSFVPTPAYSFFLIQRRIVEARTKKRMRVRRPNRVKGEAKLDIHEE